MLQEEEDLEPESLYYAWKLYGCAENDERQARPHGRFNLDDTADEDVIVMFRFSRPDIYRLVDALHINEEYRAYNGSKETGLYCFLMLLRRLAYPNRLSDLVHIFFKSEPVITMLVHELLEDIHDKWKHKLTDLDQEWIKPDVFAAAISRRGAPMPNVWGFIDGTARQICRPTENQADYYSGHKRFHCLKYQSVVTPNGLITNMYGPIEGRRHDGYMLGQSNLVEQLAANPRLSNYCVYGDPAYALHANVQAPFRGHDLGREQAEFNTLMSSVRQSVEWGFKGIVNLFAFVDFHKNQKMLLQPVGKYYLVAALLTNCHSCLYSNQIATSFGLPSPTLEEYLV